MPDGANKGAFVQGYNAQIAVDSEVQIIVACDVTQQTNDEQQLAPMLEQLQQQRGGVRRAVHLRGMSSSRRSSPATRR